VNGGIVCVIIISIFAKVPVVALTATVAEQIKIVIHQVPFEWWIQKSLQ